MPKIVNLPISASSVVLIILAGCAGARPATVEVKVPVYVPCMKPEEVPARPAYEFDQLGLDATDGAKVLALARGWPRGRAYENSLEAVIEGCR
ncbi:MAG: hypothetical protein V4754_21425 [Pseudomonadota bacterium]